MPAGRRAQDAHAAEQRRRHARARDRHPHRHHQVAEADAQFLRGGAERPLGGALVRSAGRIDQIERPPQHLRRLRGVEPLGRQFRAIVIEVRRKQKPGHGHHVAQQRQPLPHQLGDRRRRPLRSVRPGLRQVRLQPPGQLGGRQGADMGAVHPAQLVGVEDRRGGVQPLQAERALQLVEAEQLARPVQRPAEQGDVVDQRLRQVALPAELAHAHRAVALAQLLAVGAVHDRQVGVPGRLPSARLEDQHVQRRRGDPLLSPQHVADAHFVVVGDGRQVIGREPVRLEQHGVRVEVRIAPLDGAQEQVLVPGRAVQRHFEPHDRRFAPILVAAALGSRQVAAAAVVSAAGGAHPLQALGVAVAAVGASLRDQSFGDRAMALDPLRLHVRAVWPPHAGPLVPAQAKPGEGVVHVGQGRRVEPRAVGVLDAQDEGPAGRTRQQVREQGGARPADVVESGWRRGVTNA